jgi:polyisoprenoid-binding protein YceI
MTWEFDKGHHQIGFAARHLGISIIRGHFDRSEVAVNLDAEDPTQWSMNATIDAASINTGNERRDDALREDKYFDVANYPTITFESRRVEKNGDGYRVFGDLTMHGTTREIELAVTYNGEAVDRDLTKRGFSGRGVIDRFAFGVGDPNRRDLTPTVGDKVELLLDMETFRR